MHPPRQEPPGADRPVVARERERPPRAAGPQPAEPALAQRRQTLQRLQEAPPVLRRVNGEIRAAAPVIQRMTVLAEDLDTFAQGEPRPNLAGKLAGDNDWVYQRKPWNEEDDPNFKPEYRDVFVYTRTRKAVHAKPVIDPVAEALRQKLQAESKWKSELFDAAHGGSVEGTFEYVANYLYAEVPPASKQEIWDQVWDVRVVSGDVVRSVKQQLTRRRRKFLEQLIALGLDTSWKASPAADIAKLNVVKVREGETTPGQIQPKPVGIGFHTTDGPPDKVLGSVQEGGWGGIVQTMAVPFFRSRYALDAGWNPLGTFLRDKGPTYRRGVEDNELLSTVSVATDSHATLRFPLWNPTRSGQQVPNPKNNAESSYKMEVWLYVVAVREAYATYEKQSNPFGEIATASIAPSDVIGWCKLTRWHDYERYPDRVETANFWYELSPLQRNPKFGTQAFNNSVFAAATSDVEAERQRSAEKHTSSEVTPTASWKPAGA
jgi:hypothetical protein